MPPKLLARDDDEPTDEPTETEEEEIEEELEGGEVLEDDTTGSEESEDDESEESEEEEEEVEEVELPGEDDDDDEPTASVGGTTFGISNKLLLGLGIAAVLLVVYFKFIRANANSTSKTISDEQAQEQVEEELAEPDDTPEVRDADPRDPLGQDEDAMMAVFGRAS